MPQATSVEQVEDFRSEAAMSAAARLRAAGIVGKIAFVALLGLIAFTAIPYGTAEVWWKAFFVCAVFTLVILWLIEGLLNPAWIREALDEWPLLLPILALVLFSFLQTLSLGNIGSEAPAAGVIAQVPWNTISADPYQTRFFALQLLGLLLAGVLLLRYASTEGRWRILINVVIGVAVASAIYGIVRQTTQHSVGFGLPIIAPGQGYGQFINKNHFAYLMEMGLGLILGLILGGGVKREQALIYLAALLPLWTALVLCGSRGGLIAMLAQVVTGVLLFGTVARLGSSKTSNSKAMTLARSKTARVVLLIVLLGGVIVGTLWLGGDQLATRIEESRAEFGADQSQHRQGASRNEIWKTTLRMFSAHPILGVGMGGYWAAVPKFHDASGFLIPQEAHNDYLELLASGGLVAFGLAVWFALVVFKRTRENLRSAHRFRRAVCFGATIGIAGVAIHSLLDFGLHMLVNALVFTTLIVFAASKPRWASGPVANNE